MILWFYTCLSPDRTRERLKLEAPQGPPHLTVLHLFAMGPPPRAAISQGRVGEGGQHYVTPRLRHSDVTTPPPPPPARSLSAPPPLLPPQPREAAGPGGECGTGAGWKRWVRRWRDGRVQTLLPFFCPLWDFPERPGEFLIFLIAVTFYW